LCLLVILLAACTALPIGGSQKDQNPKSEIRNPKSVIPSTPTPAAVLPQPTTLASSPALTPGLSGANVTRGQIVEIRIAHVRDLGEVLVQARDRVEVGQVLARLEGYAAELSWDVQLVEEQLAEARAKLAEAETSLAAGREDAALAHEQAVAEATTRVTKLSRQVAALQRQVQITNVRLAEARATTEYRQRWLDVLKPLQEFDPWGDLPYLVGAQSGPQGLRSDLAYREVLAKAEYDLRLAELARQIAGLEVADATAQLEEAQADLEAARAALERLQATRPADSGLRTADVYRASVRISELRLARARAELEKTIVKSLVAGKVLDVRLDQVDGNDATVVIRIMTER